MEKNRTTNQAINWMKNWLFDIDEEHWKTYIWILLDDRIVLFPPRFLLRGVQFAHTILRIMHAIFVIKLPQLNQLLLFSFMYELDLLQLYERKGNGRKVAI